MNRVHSFGCRLNIHESEVIKSNLIAASAANTIVFNTCAVTSEAERQARQAIRKARRENPSARIIVTGCAAQISPKAYSEMPEVDMVLGNHDKLDPKNYAGSETPELVTDIMDLRETASHMAESFEGKARAFLQVQNGCDHRCTFCIIPFGRGPSRSVPVGVIVEQARKLTQNGFREIALTGVDITDYGKDLPGKPTLGQMAGRLLNLVPGLPRLRLSSLDPVEVDEDIFELLATEKRLMPHLHISMQSGDDMVLKRMKRRHTRRDVLDFCEKARKARPDVVFGADIIAGFPTETDAMFENTMSLVKEAGITFLHVFPYSERKGTPAARMPQVPVKLRRERAKELRNLEESRLNAFLQSRINKTETILLEKGNSGKTDHFAPVTLEREYESGTILQAEIIGVMNGSLIGRKINDTSQAA